MSLENLLDKKPEEEKESSGFLEEQYKEVVSRREKKEEESDNLEGFLRSQLQEEVKPDYEPQIHFHSSEDMSELDDESVHFAITSPPYNTGWEYGDYDDSMDYATEYLPMLSRVFKEVYRVLHPGGRFCVNVPSLLRSGASGGFPIAADITRMVCSEDNVTLCFVEDNMHGSVSLDFDGIEDIQKLRATTDWVIREQISWVKGFNTDGLAPNGSFPRPYGVLLNNMHEVILTFQKPGRRDYSNLSGARIEHSLINKRDEDMCDDVWFIHPDSWSPSYAEGQDIPVFPDKLVRRAIKLWSYEGDTVLDPFAGRFTTGKIAKQERRYGVGYEIREDLEKDIEEYTHKNQTGLFQYVDE